MVIVSLCNILNISKYCIAYTKDDCSTQTQKLVELKLNPPSPPLVLFKFQHKHIHVPLITPTNISLILILPASSSDSVLRRLFLRKISSMSLVFIVDMISSSKLLHVKTLISIDSNRWSVDGRISHGCCSGCCCCC